MKKIFAIALAVVMVLSMASAFASACTTGFDWTLADVNKCGQAKIEVVPYVKVSNGCGGYTWKVSECAGAVYSEAVFFAVRLVVEPNVDPEFLASASILPDISGLAVYDGYTVPSGAVVFADETETDSDKQEVYYWNFTDEAFVKLEKGGLTMKDVEAVIDLETTVTEEEITDEEGTVVGSTTITTVTDGDPHEWIAAAMVTDASDAEACFTLTAGTNADFDEGVVGKYYVVVTPGQDEGTVAQVDVYESKEIAEDENGDPIVTYMVEGGKVVDQINGKGETCAPYTVADVEAFLGLDNNVKVNQKLVNKNFGWEFEQEDCFKWTAASAIVDAECVVAIPKTGDASLLAWLF